MKKLLSLLLVVALVLGLFGTVGTAFAAPVFPDIAGNANEKDIVKLFTLGVIGGYADGTFKPEGNITRAEFAKIAVLALNKGGSANLLKNTNSQFKDVPAGQWYTGYVNVAVANNIIKGYADGTFKPEANISMAEAATMILRAMGYNDNLPGTWPLNYVMKAADLGIIGDTFVSDALSTRSFVCDATVAMLGYGKASYNSTTNTFTDSVKDASLLNALSTAVIVGDDVVKDYVATTGKITFEGPTTGAGDDIVLDVAANVKIATGETLAGLLNKHVSYMKQTISSTVVVTYIEVKTAVVAGKVASVDAVNNQFTLTNGTVVKLATGATITLNGAASTLIGLKDADVTALLDSNGKAYSVVSYVLSITGTLTGKSTTVASGVTTLSITVDPAGAPPAVTYTVPSSATVVRNGAVATFADLKVNDDIMMSADASLKAVYVDAYALNKTAVVTSVAVNAAGTKVLSATFADGTTVAVDADVTIAPATVHVGYKTTFSLNRAGKISAFVEEFIAVNTVNAKIVSVGTTTSLNSSGTPVTVSYITLDNGTTYNLAAGATFKVNNVAGKAFTDLAKDQLVTLSLDNAGKVSAVAAFVNGLLADHAILTTATNQATGLVTTVNGVSDTPANAAAADDVYVTWDLATGKITVAAAYDWEAASTGLTVIGTTLTTDGAGTSTYVVNCKGVDITLASGFVVIKDGVAGTFDSIKVGDKLNVGVLTAGKSKYVSATTDATFGISTTTDAVIAAAGSLTFTVTFDDVVKSVVVTVDGTAVAAAAISLNAAGTVATVTTTAGAHVVGALGTDYAGNTATASASITVAP